MKVDTITNLVFVHGTDKAILVACKPSMKEIWVPLSVIHERRNLFKKGDNGELTVDAWFSEKNFQ